jgi:tripartite-type tricarboxylate transporter receptor subunit TctC
MEVLEMKKIGKAVIAAVLFITLSAAAVFAGGSQQGQSGAWKFDRKITFISPWGPGGGSGPTIRNLVPLVQEVLGVPCEVQHTEGAGGANGAIAAERQPADGYTWLLATQSQILLDLQSQLPYNFHDTWIPVGKLVHSTNAIIVSAKQMQGKYTDFKSFVSYIKAHPKVVSVAMLSSGGTDQASLYQTMSLSLGVPMSQLADYIKIVPYGDGAEIDAALVGGHVDAAIAGPGDEAGLVEHGDVAILLVLSENRMHSFPDVPCSAELGINSYIGTWRGIWAKKSTPQAAIDAMEVALQKAWNMKPYQDFWVNEGYDERTGFEGQAAFKKLVDDEYKAMEEYLKASGQIK